LLIFPNIYQDSFLFLILVFIWQKVYIKDN
jgi:hypothetical protein